MFPFHGMLKSFLQTLNDNSKAVLLSIPTYYYILLYNTTYYIRLHDSLSIFLVPSFRPLRPGLPILSRSPSKWGTPPPWTTARQLQQRTSSSSISCSRSPADDPRLAGFPPSALRVRPQRGVHRRGGHQGPPQLQVAVLLQQEGRQLHHLLMSSVTRRHSWSRRHHQKNSTVLYRRKEK